MPTQTFSVAASADDAELGVDAAQAGGWPPSGTPTVTTTGVSHYVVKDLSVTTYRIHNVLLKFDTSSLPDGATVSSATLRVTVASGDFTSGDSKSVTGDYYDWGAAADTSDYTATAGTSAFSGQAILGFVVGTNDIILSNVGNISISGYTYLRLHINDGTPTAQNWIGIRTYDSGTPAQLIVTYTLPNDYYLPYEGDRTGKKKRTQTFAI